MAAKGVHASPKVTTSCPVGECLSFLVETSGLLSREGQPLAPGDTDFLGHAQASCAQHSRRKTLRRGWKLRQENFYEFESTLGLPSEF